jgi:hypothetical protein
MDDRRRLRMLDPLAEIRRLYFTTTRGTIERDLEAALDLLKSMPSEDERSRATVYMHGLAQMRKEWASKTSGGKKSTARDKTRGQTRPRPKRDG